MVEHANMKRFRFEIEITSFLTHMGRGDPMDNPSFYVFDTFSQISKGFWL